MISYLFRGFEKVYVSNIYEDADLIQNLDEMLEKYISNILYGHRMLLKQEICPICITVNPLLKEGGMSDVRTGSLRN